MSINSLWQQKQINLDGRSRKGGPACLKLRYNSPMSMIKGHRCYILILIVNFSTWSASTTPELMLWHYFEYFEGYNISFNLDISTIWCHSFLHGSYVKPGWNFEVGRAHGPQSSWVKVNNPSRLELRVWDESFNYQGQWGMAEKMSP